LEVTMQLSDGVRAFLAGARYAHVATRDDDGALRVTLAWVEVEGDALLMGTLSDQRKLRNLRRDPHVTLSFQGDDIGRFGLLEYLVVHGRAEVVEGGAPQLLQRMATRYLGPDVTFPPMPDPPDGFITRVQVERVGGMGPWT
jgi:PPOX class probable F420-dependent enzyme